MKLKQLIPETLDSVAPASVQSVLAVNRLGDIVRTYMASDRLTKLTYNATTNQLIYEDEVGGVNYITLGEGEEGTQKVVKDVTYNGITEVLTFVYQDGTSKTINIANNNDTVRVASPLSIIPTADGYNTITLNISQQLGNDIEIRGDGLYFSRNGTVRLFDFIGSGDGVNTSIRIPYTSIPSGRVPMIIANNEESAGFRYVTLTPTHIVIDYNVSRAIGTNNLKYTIITDGNI